MQISKVLIPTAVTAFCLVANVVQAADSAQDARLREALRQKMNELNNPAATPVAPAVVTPAPAAPKATKPATVVVPATVVPAPAAAPAASTSAPTDQDDALTARLRQALEERMAQEAKFPAKASTVAAPGAPATAVQPAATVPGEVPMVAPALPISGSKEQRLEQLLQQYKADQITPEQYHAQRAKILAE